MASKKRGWRSGRRDVATRPVQMTRHLIVRDGHRDRASLL